ncbi:hypothetical protein H1Q63_04825 [Desmonostoc muscorum CCALA 125]|nr:hypothetical protein [Desmonostoc muscorum CCALA 125]
MSVATSVMSVATFLVSVVTSVMSVATFLVSLGVSLTTIAMRKFTSRLDRRSQPRYITG